MNISDTIRKFILEELLSDKSKLDLTNQDSLIESSVIDSLGIQNLILFLEKEFNIKVLDEDVIPENFENVEAICTFVNTKRNKS